jgi:hypothetical protein
MARDSREAPAGPPSAVEGPGNMQISPGSKRSVPASAAMWRDDPRDMVHARDFASPPQQSPASYMSQQRDNPSSPSALHQANSPPRTPKALGAGGQDHTGGSLSPRSARKLWAEADRGLGLVSVGRPKTDASPPTTPTSNNNAASGPRSGPAGKKTGLVASMVSAKQAGAVPFPHEPQQSAAEASHKDDPRAEIARARALFQQEEAQREQERLDALSARGFMGFSPQRTNNALSPRNNPTDKTGWVLKFGVHEARGLPSMVGRGLVYVAVSALSDVSQLPARPTFAHGATGAHACMHVCVCTYICACVYACMHACIAWKDKIVAPNFMHLHTHKHMHFHTHTHKQPSATMWWT